MTRISFSRLAALGLLFAAGLAAAQSTPVIYPAKGQGARQQERDRFECHDWAKAQSGFDPSQPAPAAAASAPAPAPATGSMARGAAGGAAVAELSHNDVGHGAAAGALGGALRDRMRQQQARQQAAQQNDARAKQQRATYDRAFAACMEGRGYVLK